MYKPSSIDAVLITHTHVDHIGLAPRLFKEGFSGGIYATKPTLGLSPAMLKDSQELIAQECANKHEDVLYSLKDVKEVQKLFREVNYKEVVNITDDIRVRFRDASHILGSASIEVWIKEGGAEKKIVFSGDIGNPPTPFLSPIDYIEDADYA